MKNSLKKYFLNILFFIVIIACFQYIFVMQTHAQNIPSCPNNPSCFAATYNQCSQTTSGCVQNFPPNYSVQVQRTIVSCSPCVYQYICPGGKFDPVCQTGNGGITMSMSLDLANGNANQKNSTKTVTAFLQNSAVLNQIFTATDKVNYDTASTDFINPAFQIGFIPAGQYNILVHVDEFLDKLLNNANALSIVPGQTITLPTTTMIPGDIAPGTHGDNLVDIQDYNKVLGCLGKQPTGICQTSDLNNDGVIDQKDLTLVMSHFGQKGDSLNTAYFDCAPNANCLQNSNTLQLCELTCGLKTPTIKP